MKNIIPFIICFVLLGHLRGQDLVSLPDDQLYGANLFSFTEGNGTVYALGIEPDASAQVNTYGIYQFNGNNWSSVVSGIQTEGNIMCLKYWNGKLYIGGNFIHLAGNANANQVAAYANGNFEAVGEGISPGMFSVIHCFAVYNNKLMAGGCFDTDGYMGSQPLVQWNGSDWVSFGPYLYDSACLATSTISEMFVDDDKLYVRGNFTKCGNTTLNHVACYERGNFNAMGNGLPCAWLSTHHGCFCKVGNNIYALLDSSSNSQRAIMQWNGAEWTTLIPLRENQLVSQLYNYNDTLYIAGGTWYQQPDFWGAVVNNNGTCLNPFNLQPGSVIGYYFSCYNQLYLKGYFYLPGDNTEHRFGKFGTVAGINEEEPAQIMAYPNPFTTRLTVNLPKEAGSAYLTDLAGKVIMQTGSGLSTISTGNLPAATYILNVYTATGLKQVKLTKPE